MRKTKQQILRIILFLGFISFYQNLNAQNTCATSLTLTENTGWRGLDSFDVKERWHQFTAVGTDYQIKLYIRNYPSGFYNNINVHEGSCGSLTNIGATIVDNGDSLTIDLAGLSPSHDYFIEMLNADEPNFEVYNIKLSNLNALNPALLGCSITGSCNIAPSSTVCELVCNGSFECASPIQTFGPGEIQKALNWTSIATDNSPDLFSVYGNSDWNTPCNYFGYQHPYPSPAYAPFNRFYAGLMVATTSASPYPVKYQEYIQTKLNKPLVAGRTYIISFYASQAENTYWNVTNPGVWCSPTQINFNTTPSPPPSLTSSNVPAGTGTASPIVNPVPSLTNWQKVIYCYKALGNEEFLTIGGCSVTTNVARTTTCTSTPASSYNMVPYNDQGYLYIDEVSMTELNFSIPLSYSICNSTTVQIANTQTCLPGDMNLTYTWTPATALNNSTIFNPIASPTITTQYTFGISPTFTAGGQCPNINNTVTVYSAPITPPTLTATTLLACPNTTLGLGANIPAYNYTWMPGSLTGSNVVVTFTGTTTYTALYTNSVNCTKSATIQVQSLVPANFTMAATASNYTVCTNLSQTTSLTVNTNTTGLTFTWQPVALTGSQVVVTPTAQTIYTVNTLMNGCTLSRTVEVYTKNNCCSTTLTAFNATAIPTSTTLGTSFAFNNDIEIGPGANVTF